MIGPNEGTAERGFSVRHQVAPGLVARASRVVRRGGGEGGASAVEFALIASVLFMVLFGIVQFGIAYNRYQGLQAGAREGARVGSLRDTSVDDIRARVRESVSIIDGADLADTCPASLAVGEGCIEVRRKDTSGTETLQTNGNDKPCLPQTGTVAVRARYRMEIAIPLWASQAVTITGEGVFRCE